MKPLRWWSALVDFLHAPTSPVPLAFVRIGVGCFNCVLGLALASDAVFWFADTGVMPTGYVETHGLSVFSVLGSSPAAVTAVFIVYVLSSALLAAGLYARAAAVATALCLISLNDQNSLILAGVETLLRIFDVMLALSPCGAALSLDRLRRRETAEPWPRIPSLGGRLVQIQMCIVYFTAAISKAQGPLWRDGSAVYHVLQLDQFRRFPLPDALRSLEVTRWMTWGTLLLEGAFCFLIWFPRLRRPLLCAMIALHLGLDYSLNIVLFQWVMITGLLAFATEDELLAIPRWIRRVATRRRG